MRRIIPWLSRCWKAFVDLCSAWPWLKVIFGAVAFAATWVYGTVEQIPRTYLAVVALLAAGAVMWLWNLLTLRNLLTDLRVGTTNNPTIEPTHPRPVATADELAARLISHRTVHIYKVPRRDLVVVEGKVFEDCDIIGPAVIAVSGQSEMCDVGFASPAEDRDDLFWTVAQDRKLYGVIILNNCVIRRCRLALIGLCGPRSLVQRVKDEMSKPRQPSERPGEGNG